MLRAAFLLLLAVSLMVAVPAMAQMPMPTPTPAAEATPSPEGVEPSETPSPAVSGPTALQIERFGTPRATIDTFLTNMKAYNMGDEKRLAVAIQALDLGDIVEMNRAEIGAQRAQNLYSIFNRLEFVVIEDLPTEVEGGAWTYPGLPSGRIILVRNPDGLWLFSKETVERIPDIIDEVADNEVVAGVNRDTTEFLIRQLIPDSLKGRTFVLQDFQWVAIFLLIFLGILLDRLLRAVIQQVVRRHLREERLSYDKDQLIRMTRWIGLAAAGAFWFGTLRVLGIEDWVFSILNVAAVFVMVLAGVLAALGIIDFVARIYEKRALKTRNKYDEILIPLIRKAAKIFVFAFGLVFVADNLNVNVASLLAGLGIGGLAFAFAAKDTIENLFGSITVLVDRPFAPGDWIEVDGRHGTVEAIGLRSTRIRTFYNSQMTVPNSNLIKAIVDNYGERRYRRIKTQLNITYNTPPERIDTFCEGIREIIRQHPYTRKDYYHVWLNEFGAHSLDILVYCFVETPDWATELRERHRLFLDIIRLAHRLGVEFAFPTQTLYLERGSGPARPNPSPFATSDELMEGRAHVRGEVAELVRSLHRPEGAPFPPPPVRFGVPMDPEEAAVPRRNRGGGESGGG